MKNKIIILTVFACLLLSACSDYFDRKPYTLPLSMKALHPFRPPRKLRNNGKSNSPYASFYSLYSNRQNH